MNIHRQPTEAEINMTLQAAKRHGIDKEEFNEQDDRRLPPKGDHE